MRKTLVVGCWIRNRFSTRSATCLFFPKVPLFHALWSLKSAMQRAPYHLVFLLSALWCQFIHIFGSHAAKHFTLSPGYIRCDNQVTQARG